MSREYHLKRKYGITEADYAELLRKQGGCCAVCHRPASDFRVKLAIDHDHSSGLIRGVLCNYCNRRIVGRHRKGKGDTLLLAAYEYLNSEYPGWIVPPKPKRKKKRVRRNRRKLRKK